MNFGLPESVCCVPISNLLKGGKNFGLAEAIRISLELQGAGRFVQLIQSTFRQTVLALASS